jgi:hypothetical protein
VDTQGPLDDDAAVSVGAAEGVATGGGLSSEETAGNGVDGAVEALCPGEGELTDAVVHAAMSEAAKSAVAPARNRPFQLRA